MGSIQNFGHVFADDSTMTNLTEEEEEVKDQFDLLRLPTEIVFQIFSHLPLRDLLSVSETCHRCLAIALKCPQSSNVCLKYQEVDVFDEEQEKTVTFACRKFRNLKLWQTPLRKLDILAADFGQQLRSLSLYRTIIQGDQLQSMFSALSHLEELSMVRITLLNITGTWKFPNVKAITLQEANADLFREFFQTLFTRLESVDVDTQGSLNVDEIHPSDVSKLLSSNSKTLKDLKLYKWIGKLSSTELISIFEQIRLHKVFISGSLENDVIFTLLQTQRELKDIALSGYLRRTEDHFVQCLERISSFVELQHLSLSHCSVAQVGGLQYLSSLPKLQSVNVSQCYNLQADGILNGFASRRNLNLTELNISNLPKIDIPCLIQCTFQFPNLRSLNVSGNSAFVKFRVLQAIIQNLPKLEHLDVSECRFVKDDGITGRDKSGNIVGVSIANLRLLKELDISYTNITDKSLLELQLPRLKKFRVSCNSKITNEGISSLCKSSPLLEELHLNACREVNDETLRIINSSLTNLVHLDLNSCSKLSYNTVRRIKKRRLRTFEVFGINAVSEHFRRTSESGGAADYDYEHDLLYFNNNV